jgi:hypothetical protein
VDYINLLNHDNLSMIWRYYLNLVYFIFDKIFKFYHIVFLFIFTPNYNLWFFEWKFVIAKEKRLEIFVKKSLDLSIIPIKLFGDVKNVEKFVDIAHKILLKILIPLNVDL